jgi:protein ImuA
MPATLIQPEAIHPALWRGSQLGHAAGRCVDTGYPALSAELPGGGWPTGALIDLLVQQPGIGEMRLLLPAFKALAGRPLALLQPPHAVNFPALGWWGAEALRPIVLRAPRTADALWTAEQILRAGSCGVLVFWQQQVRSASLRRLHLAAAAGDTLFFMMRPLMVVQDASPAALRLALRPVADGVAITFIKRRGPQRDEPVALSLHPSPVLFKRHASLDRRAPATTAAGSVPATLAH